VPHDRDLIAAILALPDHADANIIRDTYGQHMQRIVGENFPVEPRRQLDFKEYSLTGVLTAGSIVSQSQI
jgi:hypothetical protein